MFQAQLSQIEDYLPRPSGMYLKVILGSINMSILDKEAKYQYKEQYEQFKLIIMLIGKYHSGHTNLDRYKIESNMGAPGIQKGVMKCPLWALRSDPHLTGL